MPRQKRSPEQAQLAADVGRRLLELREEQRMTREQFVQRLGKGSQRVLANYEAGDVLLPTELAKRICEEFGVTFEWLMTGSGPKKQIDARREVESRREKADAWTNYEAIRAVVNRHGDNLTNAEDGSLNGILQDAMEVAFWRLEDEYRKKGQIRFATFLDDFMVTLKKMWEDFGTIQRQTLIAAAVRIRKEAEERRKKNSEDYLDELVELGETTGRIQDQGETNENAKHVHKNPQKPLRVHGASNPKKPRL